MMITYATYIIGLCFVVYLIIMGLLKFKYRFWYSQPLSIRFSPYYLLYRILPSSSSSSSSYFTSIQHNLSNIPISTYNNTKLIVYPFIHHVNYVDISVYSKYDRFQSIPFSEIVNLLNMKTITNIYGIDIGHTFASSYFDFDRFYHTITSDTHGLSPFIGVYYRRTLKNNISNSSSTTDNIDEFDEVHGISVLLPRQKIEYDLHNKNKNNNTLNNTDRRRICSIYVCEHLAWNRTLLTEQQSIELLETTEYIQKSREIAGEQTLYRYSTIPFFVVPFTTGYTYGISIDRINVLGQEYEKKKNIGGGILLVKVSSVNIDIFYNFINECSIDFRCSIQNIISHIQHLVDKNVYHIYMLVLNKTLVLSTYIFGPSWSKCIHRDTLGETTMRRPVRRTRSQRDRIEKVREHIAKTSTALVKYLPPADKPIYDIAGKRINTNINNPNNPNSKSIEHIDLNDTVTTAIPKLISSIQKCELDIFLYGFFKAMIDLAASLNLSTQSNNSNSNSNNIIVIDTIAHNYRIIDELNRYFPPLWIDKWYYVMYNAHIKQEILCKDLFMV